MKLAHRFAALASTVAAAFVLAGDAHADPTTLKVGTLAPGDSPWGQVFKVWKHAVEERSSNQLQLQFFWNGTQGDGSQAPPGQYTLTAQVAGVSSGTAVGTYVNGTVQSVTMGAGTAGLTLNVAGLGSVPFSSVQQISN